MKKIALLVLSILLMSSFSIARAPLESFKHYMFVLVHGVGANTMIPHDYSADSENFEHEDAPRKSSIWDISRDDDVVVNMGNWFGNVGGSLQSRGFLGHVMWYDFYQPWKSPIASTEYDNGNSLSRYLGDRSVTNNPMGAPHKVDGVDQYFGSTAQSHWLHRFFPSYNAKDKVVYGGHTSSFLELAQKDWALWNRIQATVPGYKVDQETPKKYILIAHSMGGLTTRDYISGSFYKGDVDKLITLDSPHEGSGIANYVQY